MTEVTLQSDAQRIGLGYGEGGQHLDKASGIAHGSGGVKYGAIALSGCKVGWVDDGDCLLIGAD